MKKENEERACAAVCEWNERQLLSSNQFNFVELMEERASSEWNGAPQIDEINLICVEGGCSAHN